MLRILFADPIQRSVAALLLPLLIATGCGPLPRELKREFQPPSRASHIDDRAPYLLAHMRDGRVVVLDTWIVDEAGETVTGQGRVLDDDRAVTYEGQVTLAIDEVALFETNDVRLPAKTVIMRGVTVVVGAALVGAALFTIYCITNPKCLGSCPTFYVWDGHDMKLQAEGFSASIAPRLEATDVDALARAKPDGRDLAIVMKNEAPETHVVRHAHVLAARRPDGQRVFRTSDGSFHAVRALLPPSRATAPEGDVTETLAAFDGRERTSGADSTDLASRETVEVVFDETPGGNLGLVLASRQSLLMTYLFYEGLASLGPAAVAWMAALERGELDVLSQVAGLQTALGGIEVQTRDGAGRWNTVGEVSEMGPLATDVRVVPLPGAVESGTSLTVRLRMARGAWRVNQVALVALGEPVTPIRILPEMVLRGNEVDEDARERLSDTTHPLVTLPGDSYTLHYRLPEAPERYELFLESRGYYLEWIREQWLAAAHPSRAALMRSRPRDALRALASEYVRIEPEFERRFWGNRHAGP